MTKLIGLTAVLLGMLVGPAIAAPRSFHPYRANTIAEDSIVLGEDLAAKNDFDSAIIQFRKAREQATTDCEAGFAMAGERAAIAAKSKVQEMGKMHPHVGQAAFTEFRHVYEQEQQNLQNSCFV